MKKYLFLVVMATTMVACENVELEEVYNQYEEVSIENDKKKDPNFLIFKDRTQTGKEGTK
jgi:hypothetical protein